MITVKDCYGSSGGILSIFSFPLVHDDVYFIFARKVSHFTKVVKISFLPNKYYNGHTLK